MRIVWGWVGAVLAVAAALAGGIALANATIFSASAFVEDYLATLRLGRVAEVLALPGVDAGGLDDRLLDAAAFDPVAASVSSVSETHGVFRVRVRVSEDEGESQAVFEVERVGTRFLFFPEWGFARSPITPVTVTVTGDARFTVGELTVEAASEEATFAALTPGRYLFGHQSEFLSAEPVAVTAAGNARAVALTVQPHTTFLTAVARALDTELAGCVTQTVLFPTGCPFGHAISDRIVSDPVWTISRQPTVHLVAADELGIWEARARSGVAHLSVRVQSIFDGSISELEQDIPFEADYLVAFDGTVPVLIPE